MKAFALKDGDIYESGGQIAFVEGADEIPQTVQTRISTFLGEYFYNQDYGIPYWDAIQNQSNIEVLNMALKRTIEGTVGVKSIVSFQSSLDSAARSYSISAVVSTIYTDPDLLISQTYEF